MITTYTVYRCQCVTYYEAKLIVIDVNESARIQALMKRKDCKVYHFSDGRYNEVAIIIAVVDNVV